MGNMPGGVSLSNKSPGKFFGIIVMEMIIDVRTKTALQYPFLKVFFGCADYTNIDRNRLLQDKISNAKQGTLNFEEKKSDNSTFSVRYLIIRDNPLKPPLLRGN